MQGRESKKSLHIACYRGRWKDVASRSTPTSSQALSYRQILAYSPPEVNVGSQRDL